MAAAYRTHIHTSPTMATENYIRLLLSSPSSESPRIVRHLRGAHTCIEPTIAFYPNCRVCCNNNNNKMNNCEPVSGHHKRSFTLSLSLSHPLTLTYSSNNVGQITVHIHCAKYCTEQQKIIYILRVYDDKMQNAPVSHDMKCIYAMHFILSV